jgi:hypothetical protein
VLELYVRALLRHDAPAEIVYWYVWYYKINDEAKRYLQDESIKPWISVVAIFPGFLLLFIPVLIPNRAAHRANEEASGHHKRPSDRR